MFGQVIPVATTQPSWDLFIKLGQQVIGYSPAKGTDDLNIKKGVTTFAQCIDLKNAPYAALREYNPHLEHLSLVLMVEGDDAFIRDLSMVREVTVSSPAAGVLYVSASLDQWVALITRILKIILPEQEELQRFLSVVYGIFRSIGYKDLWIGLTPEHVENSIILLK